MVQYSPLFAFVDDEGHKHDGFFDGPGNPIDSKSLNRSSLTSQQTVAT